MEWRKYEKQIFDLFMKKYSGFRIEFDQRVPGRYSNTDRQVDILIRYRIADVSAIGVFDCKHYSKPVDVPVIDGVVGFMDDVGAKIGGVISTAGFTTAAINRAKNPAIDLRVIPFVSLEKLVDEFAPSLDFSDSRNSMYIPVIM